MSTVLLLRICILFIITFSVEYYLTSLTFTQLVYHINESSSIIIHCS